jgi:hypothetical protein
MTVTALDIAHELEEPSLIEELDSVSSSAGFVELLESPPHAVKQRLDNAKMKSPLIAEFTISSLCKIIPYPNS